MGATSLVVFLYLNDRLLIVDNNDLVSRTLRVAKSIPAEREDLLKDIEKWIRNCSELRRK